MAGKNRQIRSRLSARIGSRVAARACALAAAERSVANAWMLSAALTLALVCAAEILSRLMSGMPLSFAVASLAFVTALIVIAFRPIAGSMLTIVIWTVLSVSPVSPPSSMVLGAMLAAGILGYVRLGAGIAAAMLGIVGGLISAGTGEQTILGSVTFHSPLPTVVLFTASLVAGKAVRWNQEREQARAELSVRRQREDIALQLHDRVSNDLSYLVLRLDQRLGSEHGMREDPLLSDLREAALRALDHTHEVIDVLESAADIGSDLKPAHQGSGDSSDSGLSAFCSAHDARLAALGFIGQSIVSGAMDAPMPAELTDLLEEAYGNIAKHADPRQGYVLTVRVGAREIVVALTDAPRPATGDRLSAGSGLARHCARLERIGGALSVTEDPHEWTMVATLPLS